MRCNRIPDDTGLYCSIPIKLWVVKGMATKKDLRGRKPVLAPFIDAIVVLRDAGYTSPQVAEYLLLHHHVGVKPGSIRTHLSKLSRGLL